MGDREKKMRTQCLRNFSRSVTIFNDLHANDHPLDLVTKAFEKVQSCWDKLEAAQDAFIAEADIEAETDIDYLAEPSDRHQKVLNAYGAFMKKSVDDERSFEQKQVEENQKEKDNRRAKEAEENREAEVLRVQAEKDVLFDTTSAEFGIAVDAFSRMNDSIQGVVADASDMDKRRALGKLEDDFQEIRKKLVALGSVDALKDTKKYEDSFINSVEKPFTLTQKWFLSELKDSVAPGVSNPSSQSTSSTNSSFVNTKREPVSLPHFKGDTSSSPSPHLMYPTWRKNWDILIMDYDEKFRCNLLLERLDEAAKVKIVGYENDYVAAMKRLHGFYGDSRKVVSCVLAEVSLPSTICEGDYQGLISYCGVLENNFNRHKVWNHP